MIKKLIILFLGVLILRPVFAQAPDVPLSPAQAVSMLGKGILFEPQAGNVNLGNSAPYKPEYGDILKAAGFQSVRIRYQGSKNPMMIAIQNGPPYDAADDALLSETESIIDDLLGKNLGVVLTFYGLTNDHPGDLEKMTAWWGYVANRFKNKSHKLIFDLFVEPWDLVKNPDPHRIAVYYDSLTRAIRKTNPDRLIIYFKVPPANYKDNPYGPGADWFITKAFDPIPAAAGIYHLWDFHVLKTVARDDLRLAEQAWEYQDSAKQAVWSGAWDSKTVYNKMWYAKPIAINVTRRFIDRGISTAYLMMFDGGTGIFDAQVDRNGNGKLDEWTYPGLENILTSGPDIWWNMLSNPGFELNLRDWQVSSPNAQIGVAKEDHFLQIPSGSGTVNISQDVTLALKNNGAGKYNVLGCFSSTGTSNVTFAIEGTAGGQDFRYVSHSHPVTGNGKIITDSISVPWSGTLTSAKFMVEVSGDSLRIYKTGLTQFYGPVPQLNPSLWPGEKIHNESYTMRSSSVLELNGKIRSLLKNGISQSDPFLTTFARKIDSIGYLIDSRMIELLGSGYQRNADGTQYRTGGYTQGTANVKYSGSVAKYIGGKDKTAYNLNRALIAAQNEARDYLVTHDLGFRKYFYELYHAYPPEINTGIDTTLSVSGHTLTANEPGARYRWCDCNNLYNPIGGATGRSFTPDSTGNYAVTITKNGYTVTSECQWVGETGIHRNVSGNVVRLYPNPVKEVLNIETGNIRLPFQLKIWDVNGRLMKTYDNLPSGKAIVHLRLPQGVYFAEMVFPQGKQVVMFVKK